MNAVDDSGRRGGGGGGDTQVVDQAAGMPPGREGLIDIVVSLRALMVQVLERPALLNPYARVLRDAWPVVSERFDTILAELQRLPEDSDADLLAHGLLGMELVAKWTVFTGERSRFADRLERLNRRRWLFLLIGPIAPAVPLEYEYITVESRPGVVTRIRQRIRKGLQSPLGKALAVADEVLGSIGDAIPGVAIAASALGEFKGTMKAVAAPD